MDELQMVTPDTDVTVTHGGYRLKCNSCNLATKNIKVTDGYTGYRWLHLLQQLHPRHLIIILLLILCLLTYYYVIGFTT